MKNHSHHRLHAHRRQRGQILYRTIFDLLNSVGEELPQKFETVLVEAFAISKAIHVNQHIVSNSDSMLQLLMIRSDFLIKKRDAAMRDVAASLIEITLSRLPPRIHMKIDDNDQSMISGIATSVD